MNKQRPFLALALSTLVLASGARADEDLTDFDLTTLMSMDVTVTSASRRAQAAHDAAAAVFVITREDIRRSTATTIPELLRQAPGLQVARIDSRSWAVSARGFNSRFANKLQVMIDGRSIYSPIFSGVFWDEQAVAIDNIERIEIVRGPGGALWGANAVNGVINIITRPADETLGGYAGAAAGSHGAESVAARYGVRSKLLGDVRVYGDHSGSDPLEATDTAWDRTIGGWRLDREFADGQLTFQGDYQESNTTPALLAGVVESVLPQDTRSGSVQAGWSRDLNAGRFDARTHYGWIDRAAPTDLDESALGFDVQFNAQRVGRHLLTAGVGVRRASDEQTEEATALSLTDRKVTYTNWSIYGQDEIHFRDDRLRIILGAKLEDSQFMGTALQPTLRGIWKPVESHVLWAAASRAVRTPSRFELHSNVAFASDQATPAELQVIGNEHLEPEELHSYELGWRWRPDKSFAVDLALYRNDYERLIWLEPGPTSFDPGPPPRVVAPFTYMNALGSRMHGAELTGEWRPRDAFELSAHAVWRDEDETDEHLGNRADLDNHDPKRSFMVRARLDLPRDIELDLAWRAVSELPGGNVNAYDALDLRLAWRTTPELELSLTVDNVFDHRHTEYLDQIATISGEQFGRSVFARISWRWNRPPE